MDVKEPMINETMEYVISFLEKLVNIPSPSGYTDAAMQAMEQEAASWGYQSTYNRKGGLVDYGAGTAEGGAVPVGPCGHPGSHCPLHYRVGNAEICSGGRIYDGIH